jgi:hypothetical protein
MATKNRQLHIYRNTPYGREVLLQSIYFAQSLNLDLQIYIPRHAKFQIYFENQAILATLDSSFFRDPGTALSNAHCILQETGFAANFFEPAEYSASNLPDLPSDLMFMTCPRSITDISSKIRLGYIGSKVRAILLAATFPVLIPCQVFKEWTSVLGMFGGSVNGVKALKLGVNISQFTGLPLDILTQAESNKSQADYEQVIKDRGLSQAVQSRLRNWHFFEGGNFRDNLFQVPHRALIVMGLFRHSLVRDILFGSTAETVQETMPNNLLLVGPNFEQHPWY